MALLVTACSGGKQSFTLSGKFKGIEQGEFLCFSESPEWGSLDTIRLQDGAFNITHPLNDTILLTLQYPNFLQTQVVAIPGKTAKLYAEANQLANAEVSGDDENKAFTEFRASVAGLKADQVKDKAEDFIRHNPHRWASIALFNKYFVQAETTDYKTLDELLSLMLKVRPERTYLHVLQAQVEPSLRCRVGKKMPKFKATTIDSIKIDNNTFRGKPVLVSFWSTMSNEFQNPVVRQRHLMRRLQGSIKQLNICIDTDTTACQRILRVDTIGGYNVCDRLTFNSPLVTAFGLKRLPANILVDSTGTIVARDIATDSLENVLARHGIK